MRGVQSAFYFDVFICADKVTSLTPERWFINNSEIVKVLVNSVNVTRSILE